MLSRCAAFFSFSCYASVGQKRSTLLRLLAIHKMVARLTANKRVKALATKVMGSDAARGRFGDAWETVCVTGTTVSREGRSWFVRFDEASIGRVKVSSRSLLLVEVTPRASRPAPRAAPRPEGTSAASVQSTRRVVQASDFDIDDECFEEEDYLQVDTAPAFDPQDVAQAKADAGGDALKPHGREWTVHSQGLTTDDASLSSVEPEIRWDSGAGNARSPFEYFLQLYPQDHLDETIAFTNTQLQKRGCAPLRGGGNGKQEYFQFVGLNFALSLHPKRSAKECFSIAGGSEFYAPPGFSRFMTFGRFQQISTCLTFGEAPSADADKQQKGSFWAVDNLVSAFNQHRAAKIIPGPKCCCDTSAWNGKDHRHQEHGCPHVSKIPRKPVPIPMEIKNMCCCSTGIMMSMEIVAHKDEMARRKYVREYGSGTALALRLSECIRASGRIVIADAAFASVKCAVQLYERNGLYFAGCVKAAHEQFPKKFLSEAAMRERGDHLLLTSREGDLTLRALGWNEGRRDSSGKIKRKLIVSTFGTTLEAPPHKKKRWINHQDGTTEYFDISVKRPQLCADYFDGAQMIDVHNHLRQASLQLEQRVSTRWQFRFFQTWIGIVAVDSYMAFKHFNKPAHTSHINFLFSLIEGLVDNTLYCEPGADQLRPRYVRASPQAHGPRTNSHRQKKLREAHFYANQNVSYPQKSCRICRRMCCSYCVTCSISETSARHIYSLCWPSTGRDCYARHLDNNSSSSSSNEASQ